MSSTIDRLHVRCTAARAGERLALDLRARLASTARTHLPASLELRLDRPGSRRVFVDRLEVRFDFDPAEYDDVTVATLWAGAIARELDGLTDEVDGVHAFADDAAFAAAAVLEVAAHGELSWFFEELGLGSGRVEARAVLAALQEQDDVRAALAALAGSRSAATGFVRRLEAYERSLLAHVLGGSLAWDALGLSPTAARAAVVEIDLAQPAARSDVRQPGPAAAAASSSAGTAAYPRPPRAPRAYARSSAPSVAGLVDLLMRTVAGDCAALRFDRAAAARSRARRKRIAEAERAAAVVERERTETKDADAAADARRTMEADAADRPLAWWTTAGGLVYLYPWLGDLLDGREQPERLRLLGALVEPDAEQPLVDPFVRLLAGEDPADDQDARLPADDETRAAHAASAKETLTAFAALLPGLERSSPGYLRAHVLHRGALLEPIDADTYRLLLEPAPLDPVLDRLPYPLVGFRLPWSPVVLPERRRA